MTIMVQILKKALKKRARPASQNELKRLYFSQSHLIRSKLKRDFRTTQYEAYSNHKILLLVKSN